MYYSPHVGLKTMQAPPPSPPHTRTAAFTLISSVARIKKAVNLSDLGIEVVCPRRMVTRELIIEISDRERSNKALPGWEEP